MTRSFPPPLSPPQPGPLAQPRAESATPLAWPPPEVAVSPTGHLQPGWRIVLVGGWVAALAAIGAVWQAGRYAGISPWWAGPETNPRNAIITIFPFLLGFVTLVLAHRNHRFACWAGIFAALTTAGIGLVDLSRFTGLGVSQLCIAGFSMMVTLAALSGRVGD